MNTARCVGLMVLLCCVAVCVVQLRAEQARVAAAILSFQQQRIALKRELWSLQMSVARLRTPGQIHDRVERMASARTAGGDQVRLAGGWATQGANPPRRMDATIHSYP